MYSAKIFIVFVFAASITWQEAHCVDKTLEPGEHGADVVRAVISKIVFSNIKSLTTDSTRHNGLVETFMRTMAYVETRDGMLNNSQSGGIWNIHYDLFADLKVELQRGPKYVNVSMELEAQHNENHIRLMDWDSIVYDNLTIPLYSGLFARLVILTFPSNLSSVENFDRYWNTVFKMENGNTEKWITDARNLTLTENQGIDNNYYY